MIHIKRLNEKWSDYGSELGRDYHDKKKELDNKYQQFSDKFSDDILGKILSKMGIIVTETSEIIPKTKFAKFICNMAVRDGIFMKTGDTFRLNQK